MSWLRHQHTIFLIATGVCLGVVAGAMWPIAPVAYVVLALVGCGIAAVMRYRPTTRVVGRWLLLILVVGSLALWRTEVVEQQVHTVAGEERVGSIVTLAGLVSQEPTVGANSQQVKLRVDDAIILLFLEPYQVVQYGDTLRVSGKVQHPQPFSAEYGRIFPYDNYLAAEGIGYVMYYPSWERIAAGNGYPWMHALYSIKETFQTHLQQVISEPQVSLGKGLLLGIKSGLGDELEAAFRTTGLIHIVVLSGFNVMLVVAFIQYLLAFFLPLRPRLIFSTVGILGFALLVGLSATVVRASLMATFYLLAQYLGRSYEAIRGLVLAGIIMVWWKPLLLLYDIGFQLSFVATLGLILVSPHLEVWLLQGTRAVGWRSYLVATLATQIAILPLLLYHIGEFSVVAPLVNMLVLPMVAVAMGLTFAAGLVHMVWPSLAVFVGGLAQLPLSYIITVAKSGAALPFASFWIPAFSVGWVVVAYAVMGTTWYYWSRNKQMRLKTPLLPTDRAKSLRVVPLGGWQINTIAKSEKTKKPLSE